MDRNILRNKISPMREGGKIGELHGKYFLAACVIFMITLVVVAKKCHISFLGNVHNLVESAD